ncbi:MAG TPA: serine/threonine-protein kinase [Gemmatimonadales bacterium]|nr:serine/threonine-protein kinase [Gemmatimonadales bacterium]
MAAEGGSIWDRWDAIDRLLELALDLPEAERREAIHRAADGDTALESAVIRLLHRLETDQRLSAPSGQLVHDAFAEEDPETVQPGDEIGRFRILSRLGRGGMATVYRAERADGTYQQQVALKLLRRGLDTDDLIRRFVAERQILSSLAHPNIARLLDGGSTDDGRPYLVMELVEGEPIVAWADARQLDVAGRLRLFLAMADAIHTAHRLLVVHRDIKPSNVLVDAEGQVKLLDFGIAKLLDADEALTDVGSVPHTPSYASPEQLAGGPITTASDIYQAGILLLELLTGTRPAIRHGGTTTRVASRAARATVPGCGPPDARAGARASTPDRLARRLRGDLDIIIAKALREEPEERYASVAEMAEDVRRHLGGMPIMAHPESMGYRARKFVTRHPAVLPAVALGGLLLAGYVVTLRRHNAELARERDAAAAASLLATETRDFLVNLFQAADPYAPADAERGRSITVLEALRLGRDRLDERLATQPELRAALLTAIGEVLENLDQAEEAIVTLNQAIALRTELGDTSSAELQRDLEVLGSAYLTMGEPDSARSLFERELRLARAQRPPDPVRLSAALTVNGMLRARADPVEALPFNVAAVDAARAVGGTTLAEALRKLADTYRSVGRLPESEAAAREALALFRQEEGDSTIRTGFALHTLGQTLAESRQFAEAGLLLDWSLAVLDRRLGRQNTLTVQMRSNLGVFHTIAGEFGRAETILREILDDQIDRFGPQALSVGNSHQNLAANLVRQGRLDEADAEAARAQQIYAGGGAEGRQMVAFPLLTRAEIALTRRDYAAGLRLARQAAAALRRRVAVTHPGAIMADCRAGRAEAGLGHLPAAAVLLDSALQRLERLPSSSAQHRTECRDARAALPPG